MRYEGSAFHGFAEQKSVRTVQGCLREAIASLVGAPNEPLNLRGSSRTDTGVHARDQLVAFEPPRSIPLKGWVLGLNQFLPDDVAIRSAHRVPTGFVPRFSCSKKRYGYRVLQSRTRVPSERRTAWLIHEPIDLEKMKKAAAEFVGDHDFGAFHTAADTRTNTRRSILDVEIMQTMIDESCSEVAIFVEGAGFMHNMVRIMAGTLVEIGIGRIASDSVSRALQSQDRNDAGMTAPALGLTLEQSTLRQPELIAESWP
jgi:tRNA pseudouridine38-40 synthase